MKVLIAIIPSLFTLYDWRIFTGFIFHTLTRNLLQFRLPFSSFDFTYNSFHIKKRKKKKNSFAHSISNLLLFAVGKKREERENVKLNDVEK